MGFCMMNKNEVFDKVCKIIQKYIAGNEEPASVNLKEDVDSIVYIQTIVELEELFSLEVDDEFIYVDTVSTAQEFADYISGKLGIMQ